MVSRSRSHRSRGLRRRLEDIWDNRRRRVTALIGISVIAAGLFFTWEAFRAYNSIQEAADRAGVLQRNIVEGDVASARRSFELLDVSSTRAHNSTDGPLWWLGANVPVLGRNVAAVQVVAREIDQVVDEVLPGVVEVADKVRLDTYRPKNGRIDLQAVGEAAPVMVTADEVLTASSRDIGAFDPDSLVSPLRGPMRKLQERFDSTARAASAADDAARLLPGMVGADGAKRKYLLLILNNAEVRSLVGMPGSVAELNARNGAIKMGKQGGIHDVLPLRKPPMKLTKAERRVFQSSVATDMRNTTIVPDFPRAAELSAAIVGKRWKERYDGVIAVDPVAMQYILGGIGPIDIGSKFTITGTNAVSTLLSQVYLKYAGDPAKQDDVFEKAAKRVFDGVTDGQGDSVTVIRALVRGVSERRIMMWSRDPGEQDRIQSGFLSGSLDSGSGRPQIGVFVNDSGQTKMDYYLSMGTKVRSVACRENRGQELRVTTTLTSNAPPNARLLPPSVVGLGTFVRPGNMLLGVTILGPRGGEITTMTVDGQQAPTGGTDYLGHPVAKVARELGPGQNSIIITTMKTPAASAGDPELRTTPGIGANEDSTTPTACDD